MSIDTSAVVWFGFEARDEVEWADPDFADGEGDDTAEVGFAGWYDSNVSFLAVPGTRKCAYDFDSKALGALKTPSAEQIAALKATAERVGFPTNGKDPTWYFAARQS
jgi:hypothetical protein